MVFLALNAAHNQSPSRGALERVGLRLKTRAIGAESRFFAEVMGGRGEVRLPVDCICGKRNEDTVQLCVSPHVSRLMLGHCFGPVRRPAARRSSASLRALWVTVSTCGGPSVNAELGTWEPGPLAWLRPV